MTLRSMCHLALLLLLLLIANAAAEERSFVLPETVVTADRLKTPLSDVGRSVEVRTVEEIAPQQTSRLSDTVQTMSGVRPLDIGGPGAPGSAVFEIRGFPSSGTQLLLDGMKLSDPSSISGTGLPLLPYLSVNDLASIEVLKGATSVLYGSDGQAGAVNLLTKTPEEGAAAAARIQAGTYESFEESAEASWRRERNSIYTSLTRIDSAGIDTHGNYENLTGLMSGQFAVTETLLLRPIVRFLNARNDLDTTPLLTADGALITNQDTQFNNATVESIFTALVADAQLAPDLSSKLSVYATNNDRNYLFVFDEFAASYRYRGRSLTIDWQNALDIEELSMRVVGGAEYEHQSIDNFGDGLNVQGSQDRCAMFLKNRLAFFDELLQLDGGARLTHVSATNDTLPTFEVSAVVDLPRTHSRMHSSIAQGFRAPTLYETAGTTIDYITGKPIDVGNPDLHEERSLTVDAGITQLFFDTALKADLTYFETRATDAILFDFEDQTHRNAAGETLTRGFEASLSYEPESWLLFRGAYTYLGESQALDDRRAQRRPYHAVAASVLAQFAPLTAYLQLRYRSDQEVAFFGHADRYSEGSAFVIDSAVTYALSDSWEIYLRADNLANEDWTEGGYQMPQITLLAGLRVMLLPAAG